MRNIIWYVTYDEASQAENEDEKCPLLQGSLACTSRGIMTANIMKSELMLNIPCVIAKCWSVVHCA
jgi:hypothetical protein